MLQQAQLDHAEEREAAARHQAEESEVRRQEAEERRRAQELLIDVTSHELRQPVSAILNCATLVRSNYRILMNNILESFNNQSGFIPSAELFASMEEDLEALGQCFLIFCTWGHANPSQMLYINAGCRRSALRTSGSLLL